MVKTISIVWGTDDVKEIRPDLTDEQAWEVLKEAEHFHDANNTVIFTSLREKKAV